VKDWEGMDVDEVMNERCEVVNGLVFVVDCLSIGNEDGGWA
jgi:hypothetical protein